MLLSSCLIAKSDVTLQSSACLDLPKMLATPDPIILLCLFPYLFCTVLLSDYVYLTGVCVLLFLWSASRKCYLLVFLPGLWSALSSKSYLLVFLPGLWPSLQQILSIPMASVIIHMLNIPSHDFFLTSLLLLNPIYPEYAVLYIYF